MFDTRDFQASSTKAAAGSSLDCCKDQFHQQAHGNSSSLFSQRPSNPSAQDLKTIDQCNKKPDEGTDDIRESARNSTRVSADFDKQQAGDYNEGDAVGDSDGVVAEGVGFLWRGVCWSHFGRS